MPLPTIGVVLRRELLRLSRRAQTWVVRTLYSAGLLGFGLVILAEFLRTYHDPSQLGTIGSTLFQLYAGLQMFAVCLLAPLLVASGVQEERDANTLDLLALTGVGASRLLFDQIASRLAALMVVVLSAAPFLAVINTFGGFSTFEAVNTLYGSLMVAVILGNFAGFCALLTRSGPIVPLLLCLPYGIAVFAVPGAILEVMTYTDAAVVVPLFAPWSGDSLTWMALVLWVPTLVSGWGLAVPVFRIVTAGDEADDEFGLLSPDIWAVERFKRNTGAWAFFAVLGVVVAFVLAPLWRFGPTDLRLGLALGLAALTLFAGHRVALVVVLEGTRWLSAISAGSFSLSGRPRSLEPRRVWRWPVLWREVAASGTGRTRLWIVSGLFWSLFFLAWLLGGRPGADEHLFTASAATMAAALGATVMMISTLLDEKRRDTLRLLWLTPLTPVTVARQKVAAVLFLVLPLLAPAALVLGATPEVVWYVHGEHSHKLGEPLLMGVPFLPTLAWTAYGTLLVGNMALCAGIVAASVRNSRAAWPLSLLASALWFGWPFALILVLEVFRLNSVLRDLEDVFGLWYPLAWDYYAASCTAGGVSRAALAGGALQFFAMPLLWRLQAWRLRKA